MTEQHEHRIREVIFKSDADFKRWKWKLVRLYISRLASLIFCFKKEYIYAAFLMELQKADSFEEINKRYQEKIMEG